MELFETTQENKVVKKCLYENAAANFNTKPIFSQIKSCNVQVACLFHHKPTGTCCISFYDAVLCLLNGLSQPKTHYFLAHVGKKVLQQKKDVTQDIM